MSDYLLRVISPDAGIRAMACITTDLVKEANGRHETSGIASLALAEGLTAGILMGALLKVQQRVAVKFVGDERHLQKILAEADSYGRVRGYVYPTTAQAEASTVVEALGKGHLIIVKDVGLQQPIESAVPLLGESLSADFTRYLNESEQAASYVELGAKPLGGGIVAGGLLIQVMPSRTSSATDFASAMALVESYAEKAKQMSPIADQIADGRTPEDVIAELFSDLEYDVLEKRDLRFQCKCSWERSEAALVTLGREDIQALIEEGSAQIECHFCHEQYVFDRIALQNILDLMG